MGVEMSCINPEPMTLDVAVLAVPQLSSGEHLSMSDEDPDAAKRPEARERVNPRRRDDLKVVDGHVHPVLPTLSCNTVRLLPAGHNGA